MDYALPVLVSLGVGLLVGVVTYAILQWRTDRKNKSQSHEPE
jgi:hypothetical protein